MAKKSWKFVGLIHCANPPRDELIAILKRRLPKGKPDWVTDEELGFWVDQWSAAMTEYFEGRGFEVNLG